MRADDQRQLDRVVDLARDVLGSDLVGAYLFGSAVLGGLQEQSDLDVLVVSARPTTLEQKQSLVDRLLEMSGTQSSTGRRRRIELTIVVEHEIKPWRYPPRLDFQYGDWLRSEFQRGNVAPASSTAPDLAVLLTLVLLGDTPLLGPRPAALLDAVPHGDLVSAAADGVESLLADLDTDTRNVILTLARIWSTLATGTIRSKDAAAAWALPRLPEEHRCVLARARAGYLGLETDSWDDLRPRVRLYADHVVAEFDRLVAAAPPRG